jgi:hypothetical protein
MKKAALVLFLFTAGFAQSPRTVTKADVDRWMKELSNWGRWGKDDQMGTVNLVTPAKRKEAAKLVREGITVSLEHPIDFERSADNQSPFVHEMTATGENPKTMFSGDRYSVAFHGYSHSHMDALCHMFYEGHMYNGFDQTEVTKTGANKDDIANFHNGIVTRGVLIDIPQLKGVPYLEPGDAIYPDDLEAWVKKMGVKVESGDVLFIRTGRWARRAAKGPWAVGRTAAGLHSTSVAWIHQHDVAVLGSDGVSDMLPSNVEGVVQPIHQLMLIALGTPLLDNLDLEALAQTANRLHRWDFQITLAPLDVPTGTGSPLNPIATF